MRLIESDVSLGSFCRAFENQVRNVADLMDLTLEVEVLSDFESLPDSPIKESLRRDVAAYDRNTKKLFIHKPRFLALDPDVADAVLAHEIGHAYCHQMPMPQERKAISELCEASEEFVADWLACRWGFFEGLKKERADSYGEEYCQLLRLWPNEDEYVKSVSVYHQQFRAGIKRLRKGPATHQYE